MSTLSTLIQYGAEVLASGKRQEKEIKVGKNTVGEN